MNLFTNNYFTPIEVTHFAEALELVMKSDFTGILNIADLQRCSKYEFGMALAEVFGLDPSPIKACKMEPDSFKVRRQPDLSLSIEKFNNLFQTRLPNLKEGLEKFYRTQSSQNMRGG